MNIYQKNVIEFLIVLAVWYYFGWPIAVLVFGIMCIETVLVFLTWPKGLK